MTVHHIRFEGPAALAVRVATALADADGVDLTSSAAPTALDAGRVRLDVTVTGTDSDVARAVTAIEDDLPRGASLAVTES